jgi:hypothetical protein
MSEVKVEKDNDKPRNDNRVTEFVRNVLRGAQELSRQQREWNQQAEGINVIPAFWSNAALGAGTVLGNTLGQASRFFRGESPDPVSNWGSRIFGGAPENVFSLMASGGQVTPVTKGKGGGPTGLKNQQEVPAGLTFDEWYGQNFVPFDETPYRNYISFLQNQNEDTMARINAMYAQLGDTAQANIDRVGEIYESGTANLGDVYGSAYGAVEDAYSSAQQQAADQMARLGIEAAAPAVMDPMALSQAEALSGIESQRASGLGATQQYGTTAQDFASQMQQVASQQGLEVSQQILRDLLAREAEAEFQLEQARANYNPYAQMMQRMEMENAFNAPQIESQRMQMQLEMEAQRLALDTTLSRRDKIVSLFESLVRQGMDPATAQQAAEAAIARAEQLYPM